MFSAHRVLIRFQLFKLHIVNQYNVNKTCVFKKNGSLKTQNILRQNMMLT